MRDHGKSPSLGVARLVYSRIFELAGDGSLPDRSSDTLEEREARTMASTTARRRDLAAIVRVRVVQKIGAIGLQVLKSRRQV